MPVEDVFSISGRGTVATGRVERGKVRVGEEVEIVGIRETKKITCTGVEMFRKLLDEGVAGDNIGVLLRGVKRDGIERGQVLAKPKSINPHTHFEAEVYVLSKDEGGAPHAVLRRIPAAVLLSDDGRDRLGEPAGRCGDGDARRQRADGRQAHLPHRDGGRGCGSRYAKAVVPWAPGSSRRSSSSQASRGFGVRGAVSMNQRIRIRLKAFDYRLIDQSAQEIVETARRTGAQIRGPIPLPTRKERFDVLISPHVNKDARDHIRDPHPPIGWSTSSTRPRRRWTR